jgi:hypothetical protein
MGKAPAEELVGIVPTGLEGHGDLLGGLAQEVVERHLRPLPFRQVQQTAIQVLDGFGRLGLLGAVNLLQRTCPGLPLMGITTMPGGRHTRPSDATVDRR